MLTNYYGSRKHCPHLWPSMWRMIYTQALEVISLRRLLENKWLLPLMSKIWAVMISLSKFCDWRRGGGRERQKREKGEKKIETQVRPTPSSLYMLSTCWPLSYTPNKVSLSNKVNVNICLAVLSLHVVVGKKCCPEVVAALALGASHTCMLSCSFHNASVRQMLSSVPCKQKLNTWTGWQQTWQICFLVYFIVDLQPHPYKANTLSLNYSPSFLWNWYPENTSQNNNELMLKLYIWLKYNTSGRWFSFSEVDWI